jgi:hypothetical protein
MVTAKKVTAKKVPAKKVPAKKVPPKKKKSLEDNVREMYPQYAYVFDQPELFGQDVINLFRQAVKGEWTNERFAGAVKSTVYWQTTVAAAKNYDASADADKRAAIDATAQEINTFVDMTGIDENEKAKFITDMARRGIKGEQLKRLGYNFVFSSADGKDAQQDALASPEAVKIRGVAGAYGYTIDDTKLGEYLAQGVTGEQAQRMYLEKAKGLYPHLAPQFDANLSLNDITDDYRQIAAGVLEKSRQEIDFTKPEFLESIATRDEKGNYRQLSLGEWQTKLKTDDKYGYSKTKAAIQDARKLSLSIAQSFGKVR